MALLFVSSSTGGRLALRSPSPWADGSVAGAGLTATFATLLVGAGFAADFAADFAAFNCACASSNSGYSGAGGGAEEQA